MEHARYSLYVSCVVQGSSIYTLHKTEHYSIQLLTLALNALHSPSYMHVLWSAVSEIGVLARPRVRMTNCYEVSRINALSASNGE